MARGRYAELYLVGLNVAPQGLADRVARALTLPEGSSLRVDRVRVQHFPQAVSWFEAMLRPLVETAGWEVARNRILFWAG